jgi:Coenzyme PQQ synthesis protein D (PqqD)
MGRVALAERAGREMGDSGEPGVGDGIAAATFTLRSEGVTWRELDEQIVVLDLESSLYLNVTGAGAVAWKLLAASTTLDAMVDAVLEVYDVDAETARADLQGFLDDLAQRKLLR